MKKRIRDMPFRRIFEHYGLSTVFLAAYFIGVFFGSALSLSLTGEDGMRVTTLLKGLSLAAGGAALRHALFSSLQSVLLFLLSVYLCGMMLLGFAFLFAVIFYKGYTVGFAVGFICSVYGFKGLLICFLCILPQAAITTAVLFLAGKRAFEFSFSMFGAFSSSSQKHSHIGNISKYSLGFLAYLAISLAVLPFDIFIAPFFARLLL